LIVRVLRGRVAPELVATFREQARHALVDARRHDGLLYAQIGRQALADGGEEVVFLSEWRNLEAVYKWVGGTDLLDTPVLDGNDTNFFESFEVQHFETYESAETDSQEVERSPTAGAALQSRG
jgi:heme-degrading monooxygenase HmoA